MRCSGLPRVFLIITVCLAAAVGGCSNGSKSARGPEEWLPPANGCDYLEAWTAVKIRWSLTVDPAEQAALSSQAAACSNDTITAIAVCQLRLACSATAASTSPATPHAG